MPTRSRLCFCNDEVYQFIGERPPSFACYADMLRRQAAGAPPDTGDEQRLNFAVRHRESGKLLGQLQATVHDGLAEIAFLFGPAHWGQGYATEGVRWLHRLLLARQQPLSLWATAFPGNQRSCALLRRCGYVEVPIDAMPRLLSYDEGDVVFTSNQIYFNRSLIS